MKSRQVFSMCESQKESISSMFILLFPIQWKLKVTGGCQNPKCIVKVIKSTIKQIFCSIYNVFWSHVKAKKQMKMHIVFSSENLKSAIEIQELLLDLFFFYNICCLSLFFPLLSFLAWQSQAVMFSHCMVHRIEQRTWMSFKISLFVFH